MVERGQRVTHFNTPTHARLYRSRLTWRISNSLSSLYTTTWWSQNAQRIQANHSDRMCDVCSSRSVNHAPTPRGNFWVEIKKGKEEKNPKFFFRFGRDDATVRLGLSRLSGESLTKARKFLNTSPLSAVGIQRKTPRATGKTKQVGSSSRLGKSAFSQWTESCVIFTQEIKRRLFPKEMETISSRFGWLLGI